MGHLRNHVKQHRARLNLTQQELAARVGVRRQTVLAIEKGHYIPSTLLALLIARELGMTVDELFQLEGEEASDAQRDGRPSHGRAAATRVADG
jgi:putative transcriptional regulator